ncbi:MAG: aminotransferase class V-fold PLP-dependent enzyme [Gammaproteobacteria bacterium]|nr:aminotransferase class V-fold PLP-dependent enzyme [Gammaproteobacteria bacterium]
MTTDQILWTLRDDVVFLNHGSFGACPVPVQAEQARLRALMESEPVDFFTRGHFERLDHARRNLADFLAAAAAGLVFVPNATAGVNAVLRSLDCSHGDELLVTDHAYNACRNALEFVSLATGAIIKLAPVPFPVRHPEAIVDSVLNAVTARTRLALLDHVTSVTAMVMPLETLVPALQSQGIQVLIDGAHAPGMLALDLDELAADFYTGNCHKWLCAPKGAAFLSVNALHREAVWPLAISHGWNTRRPGRSLLQDTFDWTGTSDPSPFLCIATALETMGSIYPGGWDELRQRNHELVIRGRNAILARLGGEPDCPDSMLGSMATVQLPVTGAAPDELAKSIHTKLRDMGFEVPVQTGPDGKLYLRISAQAYNTYGQYEDLAAALPAVLGGANAG